PRKGGRMLRCFVLGVLAVGLSTLTVWADDLKDNFQANLNTKSLDALAKDLGALVGSGSFHQGKSLGFPLGFDIGIHVPVVGLTDDDAILKDNGSTAHATWGQAEIGLPAHVSVLARYGKAYDATLLGGGLRWGLFTTAAPGVPSLSVSGLY